VLFRDASGAAPQGILLVRGDRCGWTTANRRGHRADWPHRRDALPSRFQACGHRGADVRPCFEPAGAKPFWSMSHPLTDQFVCSQKTAEMSVISLGTRNPVNKTCLNEWNR